MNPYAYSLIVWLAYSQGYGSASQPSIPVKIAEYHDTTFGTTGKEKCEAAAKVWRESKEPPSTVFRSAVCVPSRFYK